MARTPKIKDTRTWYQKVSRGGTRYIDLTKPYNALKLTKEEYHYLEYQQRVYGYEFAANTEAYQQYRKERNTEWIEKLRKQQHDILTGERYRHSLDVFFENYKTALDYNGYSFIKPLFEKVWDKMSYEDREFFGSKDLPDIPIFYTTKLKAESGKKSGQVSSLTIESSMKELGDVLLRSAVENNIELKGTNNINKVLKLVGIDRGKKSIEKAVEEYLK